MCGGPECFSRRKSMPAMWTRDLCLYGKVIQDCLLAHNGQLKRKSGDVQPIPGFLHSRYFAERTVASSPRITVLLCAGSDRKRRRHTRKEAAFWQHTRIMKRDLMLILATASTHKPSRTDKHLSDTLFELFPYRSPKRVKCGPKLRQGTQCGVSQRSDYRLSRR